MAFSTDFTFSKKNNVDTLESEVEEFLNQNSDFSNKSKSSFSTIRSNTSMSEYITSGNFLSINSTNNWVQIKSTDLYDLRNINNKNFRGYHDSERTSEDNNGKQLSPSKSYFLTDYNFAQYYSDTNDNNTSIRPEVQKLILNQFQPYQMFTFADIVDQSCAGDLVKKLTQGIVGSIIGPILKIGGKYLTNKFIFSTMSGNAASTSELSMQNRLYKQGVTRTRNYFTSDPVQTIHNMFNGRKMAKYI